LGVHRYRSRVSCKRLVSDGLEQLLWHITAIEAAAIGENVKGGLSELLKRRAAAILGQTAKSRTEFRKRFTDLYNFRSDLVHGNAKLAQQAIDYGHLSEARDYARCIVLWVLQLLACVARGFSNVSAGIPTRSDLLKVIDLDFEERSRLGRIFQMLPDGFPRVPSWI